MTSTSGVPESGSERPQLRSFQELNKQRVQRILLVSTLYDSFILSEEGQLQETLLGQFIDLNLNNVPDLTRVPSGAEALDRIRRPGEFDLVISSLQSGAIDAVELTRQLRDNGIFVPVIALAYSNLELTKFLARRDTSELDGVFLWQGDARILIAMVKFIEDRLNVAHDTGQFGVPVILVVEDNVRFYSSFLPVIFTEIFGHMRKILSEELNLSQKMLRMRARPKVLLCRTYEEAWSYFTRYEEQVLGVISDIEFPRAGVVDKSAGIELTRRVHEARPDVRIVLQSSHPHNVELAEQVSASFLLKGSPVLLHQLRHILVERFGFGDFVFRLPDGSEVDRASNLRDLVDKIATVPAESIAHHAERNHFSNWLKARTEFTLAERLRPRKLADFESIDHLRADMLHMIGEHRRTRDRSVIADFDRDAYDPETCIARIGDGSLGGKARGIAFANRVLHRSRIADAFAEIDVTVPTSVVLGTRVFDEFLEPDALLAMALGTESDAEMLRRFLAQPFPEDTLADLAAFLSAVDFPLAVRSSSLLEDSFAQPFAGVYETYMLANNHPDRAVRLLQLVAAIKRVYASTFRAQAKAYLRMTSYRLEEEKMAVLIQRVVGLRHGDRYYPDFAGVARSHNFYPEPGHAAEEGVVAIALGMGRTVVEGEPCVRFNPAHPRHAGSVSSVESVLRHSQREFWALDLTTGARTEAAREAARGDVARLRRYGLEAAEQDGTLAALGSTWLPEDERIVDGIARPGVRLVSFAQVLKHDAFPLAPLLQSLLAHGQEGTGGPVEIEFAGNLPRAGRRGELAFLQLRPMTLSAEVDDVDFDEFADADLVCRSSRVLGNGRIDDIRDVVVVDADRFDRHASTDVAVQIGRFNAELQKAGRPYLLIGVGRWGSADPYLGIPVGWHQIAGARVIVEAGFRDLRVTPSQGTHFFQNLTSCNVGYFTVNPDTGDGQLDWGWLGAQRAAAEIGAVRHLRFDVPLPIRIRGRSGDGVIVKPRPA